MGRHVLGYFMLLRPVMGGVGVVSEAILFVGVFAGSVAHWTMTSISADTVAWNWKELVSGLIASVVVYPVLWAKAGLKKQGDLNLAKWCIAFEHGYFWPVLLAQVARTFH